MAFAENVVRLLEFISCSPLVILVGTYSCFFYFALLHVNSCESSRILYLMGSERVIMTRFQTGQPVEKKGEGEKAK